MDKVESTTARHDNVTSDICRKIMEKFKTIKRAFPYLNKSSSTRSGGPVERPDFRRFCEDIGFYLPNDEFESVFAYFDKDKDGLISLNDF